MSKKEESNTDFKAFDLLKMNPSTPFNDDMQMQDVEGVVIKKAKVPNVKIGDSVIFHYLSLNNGRDGCGERVFTFAYDKKLYHIIPYNQIFFSISDGVYSAHNNRYLVEGIDAELKIEIDGKIITGKQTSSGLVLVDLKSEPYKRDRCRIVAAPDGSTYKQGDIVMTNGAWDVPLKSDLMRGKSSQYFIAMEYNFLCHENFVECTT